MAVTSPLASASRFRGDDHELSPLLSAARQKDQALAAHYQQQREPDVGVDVELQLAPTNDDADGEGGGAAAELSTLLELVYPVVLTSALEFLPGFTSIVLAGHMDSPDTKQYVDAATLSSMFTNISAYSIGFGLTSALDTLCSQAYGARRLDKIGVYFQSGVLVIAACMPAIFLLNWYSSSFLVLLGQDPEVAMLAQDFSRLVLLGVPFVFAYELVRKVLQAQNIMAPLVAIAVLGNVVTIASGYWLTYYTSMGFYGIALSRTLGNAIMPLLLLAYFRVRPEHLSQWWCGWNAREAMAHVGLFLRLGVPGMLMMVMEWWAYEVLSLLAGILPNDIVAMSAHAVLLNVSSLVYMVFAGLSSAANIRVGNCLGANRPKQARLASNVALMLTLGLSLALATGLFVGRQSIPLLFVNDPETVKLAARALRLWAPFEVLDGLNCVIQGVFRGAGKQDVAARTNAIAYYAAGIPVAAFVAFSEGMGVEGLWLGFGLGISCSLVILYVLMKRTWRWRTLALEAMERTAH